MKNLQMKIEERMIVTSKEGRDRRSWCVIVGACLILSRLLLDAQEGPKDPGAGGAEPGDLAPPVEVLEIVTTLGDREFEVLADDLIVAANIEPDFPFNSGSTGADGPLEFPVVPTPRDDHAMAYDNVAHRLVMHGGDRSNGLSQQTWLWDGATGQWSLVEPPLPRPSHRQKHRIVFDRARNEFVLFGGYRLGGERDNSTWTFDGTEWVLKEPVNRPSPRYDHAMVYDSVREVVVLFGGNDGSSSAETWEWDGVDWELKNPTLSPAGRYEHEMVYDVARQRTVLYGGYWRYEDTWEWNGINWVERSSDDSPGTRYRHTMAYDGIRQEIVLFGGVDGDDDGTWAWDGVNWRQRNTTIEPPRVYDAHMVFCAREERLILFGGYDTIRNGRSAATWLWGGADWSLSSDDRPVFDMTEKADGIWNFTTITVPSDVTVTFIKNANNTPVRWLASGNVTINGTLELNGERGRSGVPSPGNEALGGPGGFAGGLGGFDSNSTGGIFEGSAGQGPGGGTAGETQSQRGNHATYAGTYGNDFIQPLLGGSGGGGGASSPGRDGGNGGGGGGAILVSSSKDITINGIIRANGGADWGNASSGGYGSGGAIRLIGDRILGDGELQATGNNGDGRIRLEAFFPSFSGTVNPRPARSGPVATQAFDNLSSLRVTSVAGENVLQPPSGSSVNPDVIFSAAGEVTVVVSSTGIPVGTPIRLRITSGSTLINLPVEGGG